MKQNQITIGTTVFVHINVFVVYRMFRSTSVVIIYANRDEKLPEYGHIRPTVVTVLQLVYKSLYGSQVPELHK